MNGGGYHARDLVRVPGLITLCRLPLSVVFPFAASRPAAALGVLAAAAATDVLDGWAARRLRQETSAGSVLDGVMDKVFVGVVLVTLVVTGALAPLDVAILGTREIGEIVLLAVVVLRRRRRLGEHRAASALGKLATVLQFATVALAIGRAPGLRIAVLVTGASGALAALAYARREL